MTALVGRRRIRRFRAVDTAATAVAAAGAVAVAGLLFATTPLSGSFGFAVVSYTLFLIGYAGDARVRRGRNAAADRAASVLLGSAAALAVAVLVVIVWFVVGKGSGALSRGFFTHSMDGVGPRDPATAGGAWHAIVGTVLQVGLATLIAAPLGLLTALYLAEFPGRLAGVARFLIDSMSGIPSIVAGLFVYTTWVVTLGKGFSGLAGAMALAILMLPTVARTAEEMLRLVPAGLRESSLALGAPRWRTTVRVVLPAARNGIVTAVILGVARIAGETAPLLMTAFGTDSVNKNVFKGAESSLPLFVYSRVRNAVPVEIARGWAGALVLIGVVLVLFTLARNRRHPNQKGVVMDVPTAVLPAADEIRIDDNPIAIETRDVSAWFGRRQVLEGISLAIPTHSVTAMIGPSGCGKSTFLRVLNRMHELVAGASLGGEVFLDGADIYDDRTRATDVRRRVGMVFQKPNPFPTMSVKENVLAGLVLAGERVRGSAADVVVERCLTHAGLWNEVKDRLNAPGAALSGGQQQRLCIARALAVSPTVLLMDEPCSALDPTSTRRVEETIRTLAEDVTILIVTHNMQQAARTSDHTAFLLGDDGRPGSVVEFGRTSEIFSTPNDPRTEDYINGRFG